MSASSPYVEGEAWDHFNPTQNYDHEWEAEAARYEVEKAIAWFEKRGRRVWVRIQPQVRAMAEFDENRVRYKMVARYSVKRPDQGQLLRESLREAASDAG